MIDSVYTKIIKGELPSHRIYEDDKCIVFLDIHPIQPGHTLVVTKKQIEFIWQLDEKLYDHLWKVARKIALRLEEVLQPQRVGVIVDGEAVPHSHIQLIPLNTPDGIHARGQAEPDHDALREMAQRLKFDD